MRTGVLSDDVIRNSYPEFFPLEMGLHDAVEEVVFEKHHLTGIRLPKEYKRRRNSRFPINDINNFTMLGGSADSKERNVYEAIQAYRKRFGSSNYYEDSSQNKLYNDTMYMGKNYEMRRRGLITDKLDMDSLPQKMIMSRMLSRNKDELVDINKKTRSSTITMTRLESNMNTQITSNLEGAKMMLLQVAPEVRRTAQFMEALENRNLQTRKRINTAYMTTEGSNIEKMMELFQADLPTDAKYGYGSARDTVLEDEYLRITGLDRLPDDESIRADDATETEEFYNIKASPLVRKTKASSDTVVDDYDDTDLPYNKDVTTKGGVTEPIPEDLTKYITDKEAKKIEDPNYMAEEVKLSNRLDVINKRMEEVNRLNEEYGEGTARLSNRMLPDALRLSPYANRETLMERAEPYRKTNIGLTPQEEESEKRIQLRKKKAISREKMLKEYERITGSGQSRIPHHGEADVDGSGYVRVHPTNSLLPSVLNPTPPATSTPRSRLERAIELSSQLSDPMTAQELEYIRRSDNMARLEAEMIRATAREEEHDRYFAPD